MKESRTGDEVFMIVYFVMVLLFSLGSQLESLQKQLPENIARGLNGK